MNHYPTVFDRHNTTPADLSTVHLVIKDGKDNDLAVLYIKKGKENIKDIGQISFSEGKNLVVPIAFSNLSYWKKEYIGKQDAILNVSRIFIEYEGKKWDGKNVIVEATLHKNENSNNVTDAVPVGLRGKKINITVASRFSAREHNYVFMTIRQKSKFNRYLSFYVTNSLKPRHKSNVGGEKAKGKNLSMGVKTHLKQSLTGGSHFHKSIMMQKQSKDTMAVKHKF